MVNIRENITLRACRTIANIKADELANAVGVTVDTLYKWERGKSFPSAPQAVKLIRYFGSKGFAIDINDIKFF